MSLGAEVRKKENHGSRGIIVSTGSHDIRVGATLYSMRHMLDHWEMKDGSPCGIEVS